MYDFQDSESATKGTVAIPGSELVTEACDPIVLIAKSTDLGISIPEEVEVLIVVDRGDTDWMSEHFFLFRTPDDG